LFSSLSAASDTGRTALRASPPAVVHAVSPDTTSNPSNAHVTRDSNGAATWEISVQRAIT